MLLKVLVLTKAFAFEQAPLADPYAEPNLSYLDDMETLLRVVRFFLPSLCIL